MFKEERRKKLLETMSLRDLQKELVNQATFKGTIESNWSFRQKSAKLETVWRSDSTSTKESLENCN